MTPPVKRLDRIRRRWGSFQITLTDASTGAILAAVKRRRLNLERRTKHRVWDLGTRTKEFALTAIELTEQLPKTTAGQVVSRQLLRSSTSVGANYRAARRAQSNAQFIAKMNIALEEADEAVYWLHLALGSGLVNKASADSLLQEANELTAIFTASIKTARRRQKRRT